MSDSIEKVTVQVTREQGNAVVVLSDQGDPVGIVTDHDFRERALAGRHDLKRPIHEIMSAPVRTISEDALVYEAVLRMQEFGIRHLVVPRQSGERPGVVCGEDLLRIERYSSAVLTQDIRRAESVEQIASSHEKLPVLAQALIDSGAKSRSVTRIISTMSDSTVSRLIELACREFGPAPTEFAFISLGSEGRGEQTLVTDQDNALVLRDDSHPEYFAKLGEWVCDRLNEIGYRYCRGELMAKNPEWRQSLPVWKDLFAKWINTADPKDFLEINKFFDLRCVYGDHGLIEELRDHISASAKSKAPFFQHFAKNAVLRKPPRGLFGQIVIQSDGEKPRTLNIKEAMMLIVSFARLYALKHGLEETNTEDRLNRLHERNILTANMHRELVQGYDYLMRMRLRHQSRAIHDGRTPDNSIDLKELTHIEESALKQIFSQISEAQTKINFDFTGVAE